jgi:hypothetical protein
MREEVHVYDGKYTFVMNENWTIDTVLRYGEPWPAGDDLKYSSVVLALVHEVMEARGL